MNCVGDAWCNGSTCVALLSEGEGPCQSHQYCDRNLKCVRVSKKCQVREWVKPKNPKADSNDAKNTEGTNRSGGTSGSQDVGSLKEESKNAKPVPPGGRSATAANSSSDGKATDDVPLTDSSESSSSKTKANVGKDGSLSAREIAGISVASTAIACGLFIACLWCWKKSKGTANNSERSGIPKKAASAEDNDGNFAEDADEDSEREELEVASICGTDDRNPHLPISVIFPSQDRIDFQPATLDDAI